MALSPIEQLNKAYKKFKNVEKVIQYVNSTNDWNYNPFNDFMNAHITDAVSQYKEHLSKLRQEALEELEAARLNVARSPIGNL